MMILQQYHKDTEHDFYDGIPTHCLSCFCDNPGLFSCAFLTIPIALSPFNSQNFIFTCINIHVHTLFSV